MITQKRLKTLFFYSPDDGSFMRLRNKGGRSAGEIITGKHTHGYIRFKIDGVTYKAHHLAWLYVYGYMPKSITHINPDKTNNSIKNLKRRCS